MGSIRDIIDTAFRDYEVASDPASGVYEPEKALIRALGPLLEYAIGRAGLGALVSDAKPTADQLSLAAKDKAVALVYADTDDTANDLWVKSGAPGAGAWTNTGALHSIVGDLGDAALAQAQQIVTEVNGAVEEARGYAETLSGVAKEAEGAAALLAAAQTSIATSVGQADAAADQSEAARDQAQLARDSAQALNAGRIYTSAAAGDAAVASGTPYLVQGASGSDTYAALYRGNGSGGAAQGLALPSKALVDALGSVSSSLFVMGRALAFATVDAAGKIVRAIPLYGKGYPYILETDLSVFVTSVKSTFFMGRSLALATIDNSGKIVAAQSVDGDRYPSVSSTSSAKPIFILADSLGTTTGGQTAVYTALSAATGREVLLPGQIVGGMSSRQQVIWAGFKPVTVRFAGNQIINGANTITHLGGVAITGVASAAPGYYQWLSTADNITRTCKAIAGSIVGTVQRVATGGPPSTSEAWTFTPDVGQTLPVTIPEDTILQVIPPVDLSDATVIFMSGRNDYTYAGVTLDSLECTMRACPHGRVVACTVTNGMYDPNELWTSGSPGAGWSTLAALNQAIAERAPRYFLDIRRRLIDKALATIGIAETALDSYHRAHDTVPWSLHYVFGTATLASAIDATQTSFALTGITGSFDSASPLRIGNEFIRVTGYSAGTVTNCVRGYAGSTAAAHVAGAGVETRDRIHRSSASNVFQAGEIAAFLAAKGI